MAAPSLKCYSLVPDPPKLVPAGLEREWMNQTSEHFAYRCTPLVIANSTGWELLNPTGFSATWTGSNDRSTGITIRPHIAGQSVSQAAFYFGHGILSFHPGYLFRTDPGWVICARGAPNQIKDGIHALEGIIETNWLPFPFTMNWKFTRPGTVNFEKGEPFCFISVVPSLTMESVTPEISPIEDNTELEQEYSIWSKERNKLNSVIYMGTRLHPAQQWQKYYFRGASPTGKTKADSDHRIKRTLPVPRCPVKSGESD